MMVGLGTDFWGNAIFVLPQNALLLEAEFLNTNIKIFPVFLSLCGGIFAFILYNFFFKYIYLIKISFIGKKLYTFLNRKWFFDKIYNELLAQNTLTIAYEHGYQNIDRGIIELLGPNGIWIIFAPISNKINNIYLFNIEFLKKLRNFFKILFITFIFIYIILFFFWFLNDYKQYVDFFFISKKNLELSSLFKENSFIFINNAENLEKISIQWAEEFQCLFIETLSKQKFGGSSFLANILNIDMYAKDNANRNVPYLPFDEKWIPNLKEIINNIPMHDENGIFFAKSCAEMADMVNYTRAYI
jgi:hypothetical protein